VLSTNSHVGNKAVSGNSNCKSQRNNWKQSTCSINCSNNQPAETKQQEQWQQQQKQKQQSASWQKAAVTEAATSGTISSNM